MVAVVSQRLISRKLEYILQERGKPLTVPKSIGRDQVVIIKGGEGARNDAEG